jgi:hypothetical protein
VHFFREFAHRLLSYYTPLAARKGSFRFIDRSKDFQAPPLTFFPQGHCFPHGVFLAVKPPGLDGLADKRFLVGGQMYFHGLTVGVKKAGVKRRSPSRCTKIYGKGWITVFTRLGASNVVRSPGFSPAAGSRRARSDFDQFTKTLAISSIMCTSCSPLAPPRLLITEMVC